MGFHVGHLIHHVTHAVSHGLKEVEHGVEKVVKNTAQAITHPVQTIQNTVGHFGSAIQELSHGHVMSALSQLGHGVDFAHVWHPTMSIIEHNPISHGVAQVWHGVERPVNKALAEGIKDITGHNVFGSHPLGAIASIAATVASMGGYSVVGGLTSALESAATGLGEAAAEGGALSGIESALASGASSLASGIGTVSSVAEEASSGISHAINEAVRSIPGVGTIEDWASQEANEASNYFSKAVNEMKSVFTGEPVKSLVTPGVQSIGPASYGGEATGGGWSPNYLSRGGAAKAMSENLGEGAWNTSGLLSAGKAGIQGGSMYGPAGILQEGVGFTPSMLGRTSSSIQNAITGATYSGPGAYEATNAGGFYGSAITNGGAFGPFGSAGFKGAMEAYDREQQDLDNQQQQGQGLIGNFDIGRNNINTDESDTIKFSNILKNLNKGQSYAPFMDLEDLSLG